MKSPTVDTPLLRCSQGADPDRISQLAVLAEQTLPTQKMKVGVGLSEHAIVSQSTHFPLPTVRKIAGTINPSYLAIGRTEGLLELGSAAQGIEEPYQLEQWLREVLPLQEQARKPALIQGMMLLILYPLMEHWDLPKQIAHTLVIAQ